MPRGNAQKVVKCGVMWLVIILQQFLQQHCLLTISLTFSPFAAVFLFGVAGLAETFPSLSVSGPFLLDFPGFQVPSDSIFPSQLRLITIYYINCSYEMGICED